MYTYIRVFIYIHIHIYTLMCIYVDLYMYTYIYIYICAYRRVCIYIDIYTYIHLWKYMYRYIYMRYGLCKNAQDLMHQTHVSVYEALGGENPARTRQQPNKKDTKSTVDQP